MTVSVDELARLAREATKLPWRPDGGDGDPDLDPCVVDADGTIVASMAEWPHPTEKRFEHVEPDRAYIVAACNAVPELLRDLEAAQRVADEMMARWNQLEAERDVALARAAIAELATAVQERRAREAERERDEAREWHDMTRRREDRTMAERTALRTEVARLREALAEYGQHVIGCALRTASYAPEAERVGMPCDCGFDAALAPPPPDKEPDHG